MITNAPAPSRATSGESSQPRGEVTRLLMCAPTEYALLYEINPWMSLANRPDPALARTQWQSLYDTLTSEIGAEVEQVAQVAECPDMVFTANAAVVRGKKALLANFRHPERRAEEPRFRAWFEAHGYSVVRPPEDCRFEGEGDALFVGEKLVAGYLKRSEICAHRWMADQLGVNVLSLQLADDRWYHLDTCLFALDRETVAYFPGAFDAYANRVIESNFETIIVEESEALRFACNAVVIGQEIALPTGCPQLMQNLESRGYRPHAIEMSEFMKAGGACKCLTLFL